MKHSKLYYIFWAIKLALFEHLQAHAGNIGTYVRLRTRFKIIHPNGAPRHCDSCGHDVFHGTVTDVTAGAVCEEEYRCSRCGNKAGFWAYGNWEL